jgi:hypothetical protein
MPPKGGGAEVLEETFPVKLDLTLLSFVASAGLNLGESLEGIVDMSVFAR